MGALALAALAAPLPATAQEPGAGGVEIHGFLLGDFSGRTTGARPAGARGSDFLLAEERLRLDASAWDEAGEASLRAKTDLVHDAVAGELDLDLREAYLDYTAGSFDVRLGRQIVTWGVGDLLFINDVFPKDWVSFFSGRPLEYLKTGVDGLRARYSSGAVNAELLAVPFFTPDTIPAADRFFLFDPFSSVSTRTEELPATTYSNTELALRLFRQVGDFDVSAYAYRGFWRTPSLEPDSFLAPARVTVFYPPLSVYGASVQGSALDGVLSLEAGYYDSRGDRGGGDPLVPNSQARFLAGYQRQPWEDGTVGVQYYAEVMEDHGAYERTLPAGLRAQRQVRDIVTLRLEQLLAHQTWKLALMSFYSPADDDYLLQPQVTYLFSDSLSAAVGANLFGGQRNWSSFGQLDRNDNIYISVRFDF